MWSDSSISVQWVNNNKSDIIYVRNRVAEIRRVQDQFGVKVKWVSTSENPVDLLSRGCSLERAQDELLWKRGPDCFVQESGWIADPETCVCLLMRSCLNCHSMRSHNPCLITKRFLV